MEYTYEQRTKIAEWYIEIKFYVKTQRWFAAHFKKRAKPSLRIIQYQVEKFRKHGTVHNLNEKRSGRQRTWQVGKQCQRSQKFCGSESQKVNSQTFSGACTNKKLYP